MPRASDRPAFIAVSTERKSPWTRRGGPLMTVRPRAAFRLFTCKMKTAPQKRRPNLKPITYRLLAEGAKRTKQRLVCVGWNLHLHHPNSPLAEEAIGQGGSDGRRRGQRSAW